ncbi:MAG: Npun_F5749 family FMN-dependent PPOX-type flavoprotein [Spirulinaceae cyanobacterium]
MPIAPWRSPLARALHRNRSAVDSRYFQLATVDPEGYPHNRTMVFRGFAEGSDRLQIITDARGQKLSQLQHQPQGAICWYFRKSREQFRLRGAIEVIAHDAPNPDFQQTRLQLWQNISDNARAQFLWPEPGNPKANPIAFVVNADKKTAPETFVLLRLDPAYVEHLELRGEPQNRTVYHFDSATGTWCVQMLNS